MEVTHAWEKVDAAGTVLALKYSFGPGTANTLVARLDDDTLLAVSPASGLPPAVLDALAERGDVSALVAPNAYHHMGHKAWRARWPNAVSYAPDGAMARLAKKCPDVPFEPLTKLAPHLGSRVELLVPPDMKTPDLLVRVDTPDGNVWFLGDLVSNLTKADLRLPVRMLFRLLGGGPGLRFNKVPTMVYLKDKAAWRAWVREQLALAPVAVAVPAHGDLVRDDAAARLAAALA
ncbi:MAG: hypothetical protein U1F43_11000 [Myxococcota bacterium]